MTGRSTKTAVGLLLGLVVSFPWWLTNGAAGQTTGFDKFRLFANCSPMRLLVEGLPSDASKIDLTEEAIQATAESRLRSARLYASKDYETYLYINVNVVGRAYSISVEFNKVVDDRFSGGSTYAPTWRTRSTGTHGGDAGFILSAISQDIDHFLVEFLRVNEDACS